MSPYAIERTVPIERKIFTVSFGSNDQGQFLRITESGSSRYTDSIVVPLDGVPALIGTVAEVLKAANEKF